MTTMASQFIESCFWEESLNLAKVDISPLGSVPLQTASTRYSRQYGDLALSLDSTQKTCDLETWCDYLWEFACYIQQC